MWDVITHPHLNFHGGLSKLMPSKLEQWLMSTHILLCADVITYICLNQVVVRITSVIKRGTRLLMVGGVGALFSLNRLGTLPPKLSHHFFETHTEPILTYGGEKEGIGNSGADKLINFVFTCHPINWLDGLSKVKCLGIIINKHRAINAVRIPASVQIRFLAWVFCFCLRHN